MRKIFLAIIFSVWGLYPLKGQTIRTGVLVLGNGPGAYSAAIQSARSGVKTTLISDRLQWPDSKNIGPKAELNYGIWAELLKKQSKLSTGFQPDTAAKALQQLADTVKGLSREKSAFKSLKKSGKGWEIKLANGKKIKADMLVDAAGHPFFKELKIETKPTTGIDPLQAILLSRTSIAALDSGRVLPIRSLLNDKEARLVLLPELNHAIEALHAGQAAGATAAFCSFFETDTKQLNTRMIQSELLTYKSSLFPFGDVAPADSNFVRIQHLAVTGLLHHGFKQENRQLLFNNDGPLTAKELKADMKSYYSRSQIWFADHAVDTLSVEDAISLLIYTATRGEELRREVERNWKSSLGFKGNYEPKRAISRKEFAILADTYLQPFGARIDLDGEMLN